MSTRADDASNALWESEGDSGSADPGWNEDLSLIMAVSQRIQHTLDLAAQEAELAAVSALVMLSTVVLAAAAVIVGWALLMAAMIYGLAAAGLAWWLGALVFAAIHGIIAVACWRLVVRLSRNLTLPALRGVFARDSIDEEGKTP